MACHGLPWYAMACHGLRIAGTHGKVYKVADQICGGFNAVKVIRPLHRAGKCLNYAEKTWFWWFIMDNYYGSTIITRIFDGLDGLSTNLQLGASWKWGIAQLATLDKRPIFSVDRERLTKISEMSWWREATSEFFLESTNQFFLLNIVVLSCGF